jgi:hypothetical protein
MFWGCEVTASKAFNLEEDQKLSEDEEDSVLLHLSNASLSTTKKTPAGGRFKVFVQSGEKKHLIANLVEGRVENYNLDIYFRQHEAVTFSMTGNGEASIHLTGYWETGPDVVEDDFGMGPMEMDMDEEENAELDPKTRENISQAQVNALKNATMAAFGGELEDDDEEEEDESEDELVNPLAAKLNGAPKAVPKAAPKVVELNESFEEEEDSEEEPAKVVAQPAKQVQQQNKKAQQQAKKVVKPAPEESDEESDLDDAPVLNQGAAFDDDDSEEEDSDEFDVKAILANKKRTAEQPKKSHDHDKRQKVDNTREHKTEFKGEHSGKGMEQKPKQHQQRHKQQHKGNDQKFKNKGGDRDNKQHHKGGDRDNKFQHKGGDNKFQHKGGNKKRDNKSAFKNKGKR